MNTCVGTDLITGRLGQRTERRDPSPKVEASQNSSCMKVIPLDLSSNSEQLYFSYILPPSLSKNISRNGMVFQNRSTCNSRIAITTSITVQHYYVRNMTTNIRSIWWEFEPRLEHLLIKIVAQQRHTPYLFHDHHTAVHLAI